MNNFKSEKRRLTLEEREAKEDAILESYDLCYKLNEANKYEYTERQLRIMLFDIGLPWLYEHSDVVSTNIKTLIFNNLEISRELEEGIEGEVITIEELGDWVNDNLNFLNNSLSKSSHLDPL